MGAAGPPAVWEGQQGRDQGRTGRCRLPAGSAIPRQGCSYLWCAQTILRSIGKGSLKPAGASGASLGGGRGLPEALQLEGKRDPSLAPAQRTRCPLLRGGRLQRGFCFRGGLLLGLQAEEMKV